MIDALRNLQEQSSLILAAVHKLQENFNKMMQSRLVHESAMPVGVPQQAYADVKSNGFVPYSQQALL